MNKSMNVAVFGLGSMGYGIAQSALRAGHNTYGFDVVPEQQTRFQSEGGSVGELNDIAETLDAVIVVVLNAAQTESVLFGDNGIVPKLKDGAIALACATVPPDFARQMAEQCHQHGVHYLDAPISGGSVKAAAGQLTIMASGTPDTFNSARPVLDAIAETVYELGHEAGAGSAMKAVNQLLAGVHIATMAEAITFGMTQGIPAEKFLEVIPQCAGTSWMLENRAPHIAAGDYTPHSSVDIWPKDLGIVLDIAKQSDFSAPIATAALQQFVAASKAGLGGEDDAAVAKIYAQNAGIKLPGES